MVRDMTADVIAIEKHECPACGAQAEWDPARQQLRCPFCGTESPYQIDRSTGTVQELDLVKALRALGDEDRGWQMDGRTVRCQSCNAVMVFEAGRVGQNCEFCGSPALVDYQEIKAPIRPRGVLPFRIDSGQVRDRITRWLSRLWFAPSRLAKAALVDTLKSLYIPYWTFDARAHCPWTADAGHYYYVTVRRGNRTVRERRTRWVPAAGVVDHVFDDEPVPGTHGIPVDLLRRVEPFPTTELVSYDTAFLSGHVVEHYQVVLLDAAQQSREQMLRALERLCVAQIPGDTYRDLQMQPEFSGETFKHILVPVWLLTYDYGRQSFQVIVNGFTGSVAGRRPYSAWKIALLVLAVLGLVGLAVIFGNS